MVARVVFESFESLLVREELQLQKNERFCSQGCEEMQLGGGGGGVGRGWGIFLKHTKPMFISVLFSSWAS